MPTSNTDTIATWEHVQIEKIDAQRAILLKALDLTFDERRENFRRLFDGLDSAMGSGDAAQRRVPGIDHRPRKGEPLQGAHGTWRSLSPS